MRFLLWMVACRIGLHRCGLRSLWYHRMRSPCTVYFRYMSHKKSLFLAIGMVVSSLVFGQSNSLQLTSENLSLFTVSVNGMRVASDASAMQEITGLQTGQAYNCLIDYVDDAFEDVRAQVVLNAQNDGASGIYSYTVPAFFQGTFRFDGFAATSGGQMGIGGLPDMSMNVSIGETSLNVSLGSGQQVIEAVEQVVQPTQAPAQPQAEPEPEPEPEVVYVEGYSGEIGCEHPVDESRFNRMMERISDEAFSDDQVAMAKQIMRTNCLVIAQLVEILEEIAFDEGQLELAKFAYDHIYDLENYWEVYGVFSFSSSKEELEEFIDSQH